MLEKLKELKKFLVAAGGTVAMAVTLGLLNGDAEKYTTGALALATLFLTYYVPNEPNQTTLDKVVAQIPWNLPDHAAHSLADHEESPQEARDFNDSIGYQYPPGD